MRSPEPTTWRFPAECLGMLLVVASSQVVADWHQVTSFPQWDIYEQNRNCVSFEGNIWVFPDTRGGDAWVSPDGSTWIRTHVEPGPPDVFPQAAAVFQGKIWSVGRSEARTRQSLWCSDTGTSWVEAVHSAPWGGFAVNPTLLVHDGKLWALAVKVNSYSDGEGGIWWSPDGTTWTSAGDVPRSGFRNGYAALVHDGKMWVLGGFDRTSPDAPSQETNDVWWSSDGTNWVQATEHAEWPARNHHKCLSYAGRIWLTGGEIRGFGPLNDVWWSTDGVAWTVATADAPWEGRYDHCSTVFHDEMWILEGEYGSDVWHSTDGEHWSNDVMRPAPWDDPKFAPFVTALATDNSLWAVAQPNYYPAPPASVWRSSDGEHWTETTGTAPWQPRTSSGLLAYDGKLWLLGGHSLDDRRSLSDVWCSLDGEQWTRVTAAAPWAPRSGLGTAVFDGKMWVLGGGDFYVESWSVRGDVWNSVDGEHWTQVTEAASWEPRLVHGVTVFDGKLWVTGGLSASRGGLSDVWCSPDAQEWTQATASAPWSPRYSHIAAAYAGMLWVIGGSYWDEQGDMYRRDAWYSRNGVDWTQNSGVPWLGRVGQAGAVFDHRLWMIGGLGPFQPPLHSEIWFYQNEIVFTAIPQGAWKEENESLTVSVGIQGAVGSVTYQWIKDSEALDGQTSSVLTIPSLQLSDQGYYWCIVTDESKTAHESPRAYVQVFPAGSLPGTGLGVIALAIMATIVLGALVVRCKRSHTEPLSTSQHE